MVLPSMERKSIFRKRKMKLALLKTNGWRKRVEESNRCVHIPGSECPYRLRHPGQPTVWLRRKKKSPLSPPQLLLKLDEVSFCYLWPKILMQSWGCWLTWKDKLIVSARESRLKVTSSSSFLYLQLSWKTRLNLCAPGLFQSLKQAGLILCKHFCFQTEVSFPKTTK